jgi:tetratricopeptide (TPR) repeat protein
VSQSLGAGLEKRPENKPSETADLDRYERLIEVTRLAGREEEAFDLYRFALGPLRHLGWVLGEYERGYRILVGFSASGRPEDLGPSMEFKNRSALVNELGFFAFSLGRLAEAWAIRQLDDGWGKTIGEPLGLSARLQNSSGLAFVMGQLVVARSIADDALRVAHAATDSQAETEQGFSLAYKAAAAHALGDILASRADFDAATTLEGEPLYSLRGSQAGRHYLDMGDFESAREFAHHGLKEAENHGSNKELALFHGLLARIDLAEGNDPTPHIDEVRAWTSRTGEMQRIIEAHLLTAQHLLARGDIQAALGDAETGLLYAITCGYGLLRIELLVVLARIRLAWPDPPQAIQAAREALDLSSHPDCGYAWGEADAAQVWGEAYFANREFDLARRAFTRALEVRRRIEHPKAAETEQWLARAEQSGKTTRS